MANINHEYAYCLYTNRKNEIQYEAFPVIYEGNNLIYFRKFGQKYLVIGELNDDTFETVDDFYRRMKTINEENERIRELGFSKYVVEKVKETGRLVFLEPVKDFNAVTSKMEIRARINTLKVRVKNMERNVTIEETQVEKYKRELKEANRYLNYYKKELEKAQADLAKAKEELHNEKEEI